MRRVTRQCGSIFRTGSTKDLNREMGRVCMYQVTMNIRRVGDRRGRVVN